MSSFQFQQFTVVQEKSAMKICTDATLFGAMTPVIGGETVLDIGAGSGLLALMAAQLGVARVIAVELTEEAFTEAKLNFANSPWSSQLQIIHNDIQSYAKTCRHSFDLIISNPPFFDSHSKAKDELRSIARHTDRLPFTDLISIAAQLLSASGTFYLLMPTHAVEAIVVLAQEQGLFLHHQVNYANSSGREPKVSSLLFARGEARCEVQRLDIYQSHRVYTEASTQYLKPFLLRFAATQD